MAIGKFLQLYRNASTNMATSLADADTMIKGTAASLQDGSPVIVRYKDGTAEHALLGVKGVDGNVHYVELSNSQPITNKRLAEEFKKLTVSVVAAEANANGAKVTVTPTGSAADGYTYTVGLENVASTSDVADVQTNVNKIGLTSEVTELGTKYTFTDGKGSEPTIFTIDKDSSLVSVKLGKYGEEGTFVPDAAGQILEFVYELSDNTQTTTYIDFGHVITDAEFSALVGNGLSYTDGKLNVEVDGTYVKVVDDKVTVNVAALGTELVKDGESAINGAIDAKIQKLDVTEITKEGEVIVAVSQTDGIVSARTGKVDGANVTFTKSGDSAIAATNVSAAIMEIEDTIKKNQASALGVTEGNGISITGEGNVKTISVKLNETANNALVLGTDGLSLDIAEGSENGTIAVNKTDVKVHGLGSAAYTSADAYEAFGAVDAAIEALDAEVEYKAADATGLVESVKVTQVNGVITSVAVVESNIWDCGTFGSN